MPAITRRAQLGGMLGGMLGLAGSAAAPGFARAAEDAPIGPEGLGNRIRHIAYSDLGGRADSVQIMRKGDYLYVGHMFSDGITVLDVADPRAPKPVTFFTGGPNTRSHHLQVAGDLLLAVNGANILALQTYDQAKSYYENSLADNFSSGKSFAAGLRIYDVSKPASPREIAFLAIPGIGLNRLWYVGGRYAYISAHFDGFTDHILAIVDMQEPTKPEIVGRFWLPGMNRAAGETPGWPKGKRVALHHMITAGNLGYAAWRDGGFTILDISDVTKPRLLSHINFTPPYPGGTHTPLPLPGRGLALVLDESNGERCAKGISYTWVVDVRAPENPVPIATLPTPRGRDFCALGNFGPHNLHENRPGSFQSETLAFATYHNAGVRAFDISNQYEPREVAFWIPPNPTHILDPRPGIALAPQACDVYVRTDGLMFMSDWNAGVHVLQYEG